MAEFLQDNLRVFVVPVDIFEVPDLSMAEQMVYIVLRSYTNPYELTAFPSYPTIAKKARMSKRNAIRVVQSLVEKGLIKKEIRLDVSKNRKIRNTSNFYTLNYPKKLKQNSDTMSPSPVTPCHAPSDTMSPEHNHLTKSNRTNDDVVDEKQINAIVERFKKDGHKVTPATIKKWITQSDYRSTFKTVIYVLNQKSATNPVGLVTHLLKSGEYKALIE